MGASRHREVGWMLVVAGVIGVVTGLVPFTISALRVLADENRWNVTGLAAHGAGAMGLSVEWVMLSSAMGAYLGALLLCAGLGWVRGRAWAGLVTWCYVTCGLAVNAMDMLIFIFRARPGPMRSHMLVFDGLALAFPAAVAAWLVCRRGSAPEERRPPPSRNCPGSS